MSGGRFEDSIHDEGGESLPQDAGQARVSVHAPVLLREALAILALEPGQVVVDGTVGAGGHARAIASAIAPGGRLLGLDRDAEILVHAKSALAECAPTGVRLFHLSYTEIGSALAAEGLTHCDRVLLDLGVSSLQLDCSERGFSFMNDGPLDMRMDRSSGEPVAAWLARVRERELADVIFRFGEERHSRRIARAIVEARARTAIRTTGQLAEIVARAQPRPAHAQRIHPATRTFQALRILANDELATIERGLAAAAQALRPGGRLAVISFHSLEDRLCKNFLRERMTVLTKKPIVAGDEECRRNPRARSAKLRAGQKLEVAG